ncbi:MAG: potassium/proton antiporter [Peptoniphilaceae bacterium]|nr:potassium/proton antiporter [Peptoniphilaceae bacterium]MDY6085146.1 potassium/proton antiporter [Peptoniphilaceae bacterium]
MNAFLLLMAILVFASYFLKKLSRVLGIPVLLLFIVLGMVFGREGLFGIQFTNLALTEKLTSVALIFIMFYGGFGTNIRAAKPVLPESITLASLGVVATSLLTSAFVYFVLHWDWPIAFLMGAVTSSTDAASVFTILRSRNLGLKYNTASLLEVESGSNDPTAYMLTMIGVSLFMGQASMSGTAVMVLKQVGWGLFFGIAMAYLTRFLFDTLVDEGSGYDDLFIAGTAVISYALPNLLGGNGYLSTYIAGVILGNGTLRNKKALVNFFDGVTTFMQMVLFFLLGLVAVPSAVIRYFPEALIITLFLTFVSRPVSTFLLMKPFKSPKNQIALVSFSGLRGAASIVFAIVAWQQVGGDLPVVHVTFFLVLFSILIQGSLLPRFAQKVDMVDENVNNAKTFNDYTEEVPIQAISFRLPDGHPWVGRTVAEVTFPPQTLATAIFRGHTRIVPNGETRLEDGDVVTLAAHRSAKAPEEVEKMALTEINVEADDRYCGKRIAEIPMPKNTLITFIIRGDNVIVPDGDVRLEEDDVLVVSR